MDTKHEVSSTNNPVPARYRWQARPCCVFVFIAQQLVKTWTVLVGSRHGFVGVVRFYVDRSLTAL